MIVAGPVLSAIYERVDRLAVTNIPVLICGETGCGKELVATALHARSPRAGRALIAVNCAALHANLVESELFGHERGAFSGATASQIGKIEAAKGSTLFLDEVGELLLTIQAKLLRVLEIQRFIRLGDTREREADVRIVAATNRDLEHEVEVGRFRKDLYYRLAAATVYLPPLRERAGEVSALAHAFLDAACSYAKRSPMSISPEALSLLEAYAWPGNVRELKNLMSYVAAVISEDTIRPEHIAGRLQASKIAMDRLPPRLVPSPGPPDPSMQPPRFRRLADELRELEITRMREALVATDGNRTRAARLLEMPIRTFFEKAKLYGLAGRQSLQRDGGEASSASTPTTDEERWDDRTLVHGKED